MFLSIAHFFLFFFLVQGRDCSPSDISCISVLFWETKDSQISCTESQLPVWHSITSIMCCVHTHTHVHTYILSLFYIPLIFNFYHINSYWIPVTRREIRQTSSFNEEEHELRFIKPYERTAYLSPLKVLWLIWDIAKTLWEEVTSKIQLKDECDYLSGGQNPWLRELWIRQERELRSHTGMKDESGCWGKQEVLGYHRWACKYYLESGMKVVRGCAKDTGRELAALWRGRVELSWEKLKAKTGERSLPLHSWEEWKTVADMTEHRMQVEGRRKMPTTGNFRHVMARGVY